MCLCVWIYRLAHADRGYFNFTFYVNSEPQRDGGDGGKRGAKVSWCCSGIFFLKKEKKMRGLGGVGGVQFH